MNCGTCKHWQKWHKQPEASAEKVGWCGWFDANRNALPVAYNAMASQQKPMREKDGWNCGTFASL